MQERPNEPLPGEFGYRARLLRFAPAALLIAAHLPAQEPRSNVGLPAAAAVAVFGGGAWLERKSDGAEGGGSLDLGWLRGRGLRLQGEAAILRATLTETVPLDPNAGFRDSTYQGSYYDLSVSVTAVMLIGGADARAAPYLVVGIGVHALSSSFGTLTLDRRYNTNVFGAETGVGVRVRLGQSGRQGFFVEGRRVIAENVDRTVLRAGVARFFGDLSSGT